MNALTSPALITLLRCSRGGLLCCTRRATSWARESFIWGISCTNDIITTSLFHHSITFTIISSVESISALHHHYITVNNILWCNVPHLHWPLPLEVVAADELKDIHKVPLQVIDHCQAVCFVHVLLQVPEEKMTTTSKLNNDTLGSLKQEDSFCLSCLSRAPG